MLMQDVLCDAHVSADVKKCEKNMKRNHNNRNHALFSGKNPQAEKKKNKTRKNT